MFFKKKGEWWLPGSGGEGELEVIVEISVLKE